MVILYTKLDALLLGKKDENFVSNKLMRMRRANRPKVSFVLFQWWKFDRSQLACYQILFFQFATDAAPHCLEKQSSFYYSTNCPNWVTVVQSQDWIVFIPRPCHFGLGGVVYDN